MAESYGWAGKLLRVNLTTGEITTEDDTQYHKYIGGIMPVLTKNKLVEGIHGKGGGYRLTKAPNEYKIGDILSLTEGDLSPVACLKADAKPCPRKAQCATVGLWEELKEVIGDFLDKKTLSDLMN